MGPILTIRVDVQWEEFPVSASYKQKIKVHTNPIDEMSPVCVCALIVWHIHGHTHTGVKVASALLLSSAAKSSGKLPVNRDLLLQMNMLEIACEVFITGRGGSF